MFIPLLISALHLSSSVTVPLNADSPLLFVRDQPECTNVARYRTLQAIIWSCLATMFACTWVSVHPNLPAPNDSMVMRFRRRMLTMVYALLAPELVAMWALRQRIAARTIANRFNSVHEEKGVENWTLTHGFFVQMGGFILYKDKRAIRALTFNDLFNMIASGKVDPPDISEDEISDKSKGDFLTKLFVVLQTTWFAAQCIVRWASHLPVTELEVVTLAFAVLNMITYALWWKKPQNVLIAVRVELKETAEGREIGPLPEKKKFTRKLREEMNRGLYGLIVRLPYRLIQVLMRPFGKMNSNSDAEVRHGSLRLPMFYADAVTKRGFILAIGIATLFGGLHFIPWSSSFPSYTERWIWRSSALITSIHPAIFLFCLFSSNAIDDPLIGSGVLYIAARLALLTVAFTTLRELPSRTYNSIEWTSFFPHI